MSHTAAFKFTQLSLCHCMWHVLS